MLGENNITRISNEEGLMRVGMKTGPASDCHSQLFGGLGTLRNPISIYFLCLKQSNGHRAG